MDHTNYIEQTNYFLSSSSPIKWSKKWSKKINPKKDPKNGPNNGPKII